MALVKSFGDGACNRLSRDDSSFDLEPIGCNAFYDQGRERGRLIVLIRFPIRSFLTSNIRSRLLDIRIYKKQLRKITISLSIKNVRRFVSNQIALILICVPLSDVGKPKLGIILSSKVHDTIFDRGSYRIQRVSLPNRALLGEAIKRLKAQPFGDLSPSPSPGLRAGVQERRHGRREKRDVHGKDEY